MNRMTLALVAPAALVALTVGGCAHGYGSSSHSAPATSASATAAKADAAPAAPAAPAPTATTAPAAAASSGTGRTLADGLQIEDLVVGNGALAESGMTASVHYTGWLTNGTKFDSSLDRGTPFSFQLGGGQVIRGWDEGVVGMRVGGKRKLTIPPGLGYGAAGAGGVIPPNATLVFEVQLLQVH